MHATAADSTGGSASASACAQRSSSIGAPFASDSSEAGTGGSGQQFVATTRAPDGPSPAEGRGDNHNPLQQQQSVDVSKALGESGRVGGGGVDGEGQVFGMTSVAHHHTHHAVLMPPAPSQFQLRQRQQQQDKQLGAAASPTSPAGCAPPPRGWSPMQRLGVTLLLPLLMLYCAAAFAVAWLLTCTIVPSYLLAQRLYWACPFIPHIWARLGPLAGTAARLGFEASHSINVLTRLLTLPLRPHLPAFYVLGFPKCGTTSLAEHLRSHPGLSATAGLPYHEALAKESHFFQGVYGRSCAWSRTLYRSCFPTVVTRWWHEVVLRAPAWMCFDACPVNACMPHAAERIRLLTPQAKLIVMLRDPVPGVFSAEIMMRDMGVPLTWSLTEAVAEDDPKLAGVPKDVAALWRELAALGPTEPLPERLPTTLYTSLGATLQCGMYAELLQPFLDRFPLDSFMFIHFSDLVSDTEGVVRQVLDFVGADTQRYQHRPLPPAMKNNYGARRMHPTVRAALGRLYAEPNRQLAALLKRNDLGWAGLGAVEKV